MIYPKLNASMKWKNDYIFLRKNKKKNTRRNAGCVARWLAISARKPKVPGSSPAGSYAQS